MRNLHDHYKNKDFIKEKKDFDRKVIDNYLDVLDILNQIGREDKIIVILHIYQEITYTYLHRKKNRLRFQIKRKKLVFKVMYKKTNSTQIFNLLLIKLWKKPNFFLINSYISIKPLKKYPYL